MNRIHEIEDLNAKLNAEKLESHKTIEKESKELIVRLEQATTEITSKSDESQKILESKIESNYVANKNKINDLVNKITYILDDVKKDRDDLQNQIFKLNDDLGNAKLDLINKMHIDKAECTHEYQQMGEYFR